MRTCKDIEPIMLSYVSGEILASQKRILDEHLKECDLCSDEMIKLQSLDLTLVDLQEEEIDLPGELKSAILNGITVKKHQNLRKVFSATSLLSAATVVLAVLVFILVGKVDKISVLNGIQKTKSVKILFFSDTAKDVSLVGDFNNWGSEPLALVNVRNGTWEAELELLPGMYQYNLVVDGEDWVSNPNSKGEVPDGFGGTNSVVIVNGGNHSQTEDLGERI